MSDTNYLLFRSAGHTVAVRAELTRQVVPLEQLSALPGTQGIMLGVMAALGRVLPVVNLAAIAGWETSPVQAKAPLALICEVGRETIALPIDDVIGFVKEEDAPTSTDLLSEETLLGGYLGGGHKGQVLNPQALLASVQGRIVSA